MATFTSSDALTNVSHLLPTGTFLAFQALAPLFTNNGICGRPEKIVTGVLLGFFFALCFGLSFVDSITAEDGTVYYGIVTSYGLYNPKFKTVHIADEHCGVDTNPDDPYFKGSRDKGEYVWQYVDVLNGALNCITFGALSCLTPPITTCFYPRLSQTVVKTGPILAGLFAGVLFAVFPSGRHGVGFASTTDGTVKISANENVSDTPAGGSGTPAPDGTPAGGSGTPANGGDLETGPKRLNKVE